MEKMGNPLKSILFVSWRAPEHYCSRNIWATYGLHMGHIWGPVLQHMELFQHMGKKILQKAQHMGNIWVSFSNIWGSFETYRSFLKHMGPFVKGLCFFFRPATLHYSGI